MPTVPAVFEFYRVRFKAELLPGHPLFYKVGDACLTVCLWAKSPEQAEALGRAFAPIAHIEITGLLGLDSSNPLEYKHIPQWAKGAIETGFAFFLHTLVIGAD